MKLRIRTENMMSFQRYTFSQNRFYGLWFSPRPLASVGVNTRIFSSRCVACCSGKHCVAKGYDITTAILEMLN